MPTTKPNLQRDTLRKIANSKSTSTVAKELALLRLDYSLYSKLLSGYINKLVNVNRIYPRHLPTQASFRWSTFDPPITNWPRQCINQSCPDSEHEWTDQCWSVRDILKCDSDELLITWDHDNIEGKIHDLIVNDQEAILAHQQGYDLHTITCCNIFSYQLPVDLRNPHTSEADTAWRTKYNWQGKDTKQRVLAKNFNHGSKYSKSYTFIHKIQGIEKYGVSRSHLISLAKRYIESKKDPWNRKLSIMRDIQRKRIARTLYGGRRVFFTSDEETAREGFSHMISGTVSDYNNETLILLEQEYGDDIRLLHNAHDGNKVALKKSVYSCEHDKIAHVFKNTIERSIEYKGRSLIMTAGVRVYE